MNRNYLYGNITEIISSLIHIPETETTAHKSGDQTTKVERQAFPAKGQVTSRLLAKQTSTCKAKVL